MRSLLSLLPLELLPRTGLSYPSLSPVHTLSKAAIARWSLMVVHISLALLLLLCSGFSGRIVFFPALPLASALPSEQLLSAHITLKVSHVSYKSHTFMVICSVFQEHIYKEILSFSPIARKDSKKRSGMSL